MLALPALQAVSALLAEFPRPSPFPLAVFAVPWLAACTDRGHISSAAPAARSSPLPGTDVLRRAEAQKGGRAGAQAPGSHPLTVSSPCSLQSHPTLIHATMPRAGCSSFTKPCCFLASPMSPVSPPAGINTEQFAVLRFSDCDPHPGATSTPSQTHCCPAYPICVPEPAP